MKFYSATGKPITGNNLQKLLTVKNVTPNAADLYFYGDIVSDWWGAWTDEDQYPAAIRDFLQGCDGKDLNIYINSGGGSVYAGIAIYNMLKRHSGYKTVYVDGLAASIASVIALAGDKIIIPSNAYMMIHKPTVYAEGNATELKKLADDLDVIEAGIINVYQDHLADGANIEDIKNMVDAETWLTGQEAQKYFDIEVGQAKQYAAKVTDTVKAYDKVPKEIIASAQAGDNTADITAKIKTITISGMSKGVF